MLKDIGSSFSAEKGKSRRTFMWSKLKGMRSFGSALYHWQVPAAFVAENLPRFRKSFRKIKTNLRRDTVSTLAVNVEPLAIDVSCTDNALRVVLADGREISVPLVWFPRLLNATAEQRGEWRLIGGGIGIHWEPVDEDISVESLLAIK
jgi:hypothetical protein